MIARVIRVRLSRIGAILRGDPLALTEILSGAVLVALRGAMLKWGAALNVPHDVAGLLQQAGLTEERWGTYLMCCGVLQIAFAGTRHSTLRVLVTVAILAGFVTMAAAFLLTTGSATESRSALGATSLICMSTLYTFILARVFHDQDRTHAVRPGGHT